MIFRWSRRLGKGLLRALNGKMLRSIVALAGKVYQHSTFNRDPMELKVKGSNPFGPVVGP